MRTPMGTVETARHFKGASFSVQFTPPKKSTRERTMEKKLWNLYNTSGGTEWARDTKLARVLRRTELLSCWAQQFLASIKPAIRNILQRKRKTEEEKTVRRQTVHISVIPFWLILIILTELVTFLNTTNMAEKR